MKNIFKPNEKRSIKQRIVILVVLILFLKLLNIPNEVIIKSDDQMAHYTLTFSELIITEFENGADAEIFVEEYDCSLAMLYGIVENIDLDELKTLEQGETIYIGVYKDVNLDEDGETILIELKTDNKVFFSYNEYNEVLNDGKEGFYQVVSILAIIDLIIILYNVILLFVQIGKKVKNRTYKTGNGSGS